MERMISKIYLKYSSHLPFLIFFISLSLRFSLCLFNREANDNHMEVINWILDHGSVPVNENCWECSQPKFYYLLNASVMSLLHIDSPAGRIVCAQMINFLLSAILLFFAWAFIRNQPFPYRVKIISFCLVALNPCLAGINAQVTNDTLAILAGTMTIYYADLFFRKLKILPFAGLTMSVILACITKGSGLSLALGMVVIYAVYLFFLQSSERKLPLSLFAIFIFCYLAIVPFAGGYFSNYKKYNNPFINNITLHISPPDFFHQTYVLRPGITSIVHGYFTFRLIELIEHPYITDTVQAYPLHRTSLWSQLYGHTFFLHFDQHPGSWATLNPAVLNTGSALLTLGLVPLGLFLFGSWYTCKDNYKAVKNRIGSFITTNLSWIHIVFFVSSVLFIVKYTYDYRDFASMKSIFVFPVLLSIVALFMEGVARIKSEMIARVIIGAVICLSLFSILDLLFLVNQLRK